MIICRAEGISRHYTSEPVFEDLSFQIDSGQRIGLVGPNGAGKSTLLRVLTRQDAPDSGQIHLHGDVSVAMLSQFVDFAPDQTLLGEVKTAMSHLESWHDRMLNASHQLAMAAEAERPRWEREFDHYQELLRRHGGYEFGHRIEEVLFGLGFSAGDFDRPLATFSGGQQSRVLLAKLLLRSPDLMLLDEPTNHLDIETTEWLEDYLLRQPAAMVIVSHDRYFLDKTVTCIYELLWGRLNEYPGNYQNYAVQRAERQKTNERIYARQREAIEHNQDFVRRNSYGQLAKQAKSREKMIARLESELVERVGDVSGPHMKFGAAERSGDIVISARELGMRYAQTLFAGFSIEIERGQRIGVIGANGSGKTTLLRILLGMEVPTTGTAKLGHNVKPGYLDQELSLLDLSQTPLEAVRPPWRVAEKEEPFRALLARFGIGPDLCEKTMNTLSGGERTRVALARICAFEVNLLALDEPTNHLDLWARESLERSLADFEGTVIVVSHDRYFLNQTVDRLLLVANGKVRLIAGNYQRFVELKQQEKQQAADKERAAAKETKPVPAAPKGRKRCFPFRKVSDIESEISAHEVQIAALEASLLTPEVYKDGRKAREVADQLDSLKTNLLRLMEHWEEAMELNPQ